MIDGEMMRALHSMKNDLPRMLWEQGRWRTLDINYDPPHVERVWTQYFELRVSLHRIFPCEKALYHPHPCPSVIEVCDGIQAMQVGFGPGDAPPPVAATLLLPKGSIYEMVDPDGWHSVRPVGKASMSIMVTGLPWGRNSPGKDKVFGPLSQSSKEEILSFFRAAYAPC